MDGLQLRNNEEEDNFLARPVRVFRVLIALVGIFAAFMLVTDMGATKTNVTICDKAGDKVYTNRGAFHVTDGVVKTPNTGVRGFYKTAQVSSKEIVNGLEVDGTYGAVLGIAWPWSDQLATIGQRTGSGHC